MAHALFFSLIAVFFAFLSRYRSFKFGLEISFLILAIFMGIRFNWGNDYSAYLDMFYKNTFTNDFSKDYFIEILTDENSEFGWKILNMLFKPFGFFSMVFVLTFFEYFVLYKAIKKYVAPKWYWLAVFLFTFNSGFMLTGCSMMRQYLAMSIVLLAVKYLVNGNAMKYVLCILFAATFHTSSLIMLPFYLVRFIPQNIDKKAMIWIIIGSFVYYRSVSILLSSVFSFLLTTSTFEQYEEYADVKAESGGMGIGIMYYFCIFFIALKSGKYLNRGLYCMAVLSSLYVIIIPFTTVAPLVGRLGYYFSYFSILTFPVMFEKMPKSWWMSLFLLFSLFFTYRLWFTFFNSDVWYDSMFEYKSIFSAPMWL